MIFQKPSAELVNGIAATTNLLAAEKIVSVNPPAEELEVIIISDEDYEEGKEKKKKEPAKARKTKQRSAKNVKTFSSVLSARSKVFPFFFFFFGRVIHILSCHMMLMHLFYHYGVTNLNN